MTVTFTVEDGTGLPAANSYASVAEADDYMVTVIHTAAAWAALSTPQKQYLLVWASRTLDYRVTWYGDLAVAGSGLLWPRTGAVDRYDTDIDEDVVPPQVKMATFELARALMAQDRMLERSQDQLASLKVDVIELEFRAGYILAALPPELALMLQGLGSVRSGKIGFARIIRA